MSQEREALLQEISYLEFELSRSAKEYDLLDDYLYSSYLEESLGNVHVKLCELDNR